MKGIIHEEIVHIVPLGWEIDRAIEPIKRMKAHRVHLIYRYDTSLIKKYIPRVVEKLEADNIEVKHVKYDGKSEFFDWLLWKISQIIIEESRADNRIHINISASGKIDAAAAFLAGMYHKEKIGSAYYVVPESYSVQDEKDPKKCFDDHGLSVGMAGFYSPPSFQIARPDPESLFVLTYIYNNGPQTYLALINALKNAEIAPFDSADVPEEDARMRGKDKKNINNWTMRLRRLILNGLKTQNYVDFKPSYDGRKYLVELTKDGEYTAILSGEIQHLR